MPRGAICAEKRIYGKRGVRQMREYADKSIPRMHFAAIGDDYVSGIICQKLGFTGMCIKQCPCITKRPGRRIAFTNGRVDAHHFTLRDVSSEMGKLRESNPPVFDAKAKEIGLDFHEKVMEAIAAGPTMCECRGACLLEIPRSAEQDNEYATVDWRAFAVEL